MAAVQGHGPPKMRVSVGVILNELRSFFRLAFCVRFSTGGRGAERTAGQSQRPEKLMTADGGAFCVRFGMASQSPGGFGRPPGLHTTTRELQTRTFERPGASNTTTRGNPQREKKE